MHTLLDLHGAIPTFISITDGKVADVNLLDDLILEAGSIYLMDRGYLDFLRLYQITLELAFFVTRSKSNTQFKRIKSGAVDKTTGLICDQTILLKNYYALKDYPKELRRVKYYDKITEKNLTFLTNNFALPALTIAQLYKCRWQVELFFKWIKQHLRIKKFYGTSENAVKTQIWIAISMYVLIAIIKKRLGLKSSLYTILQILSVNIFEKKPISQVFAGDDEIMSKNESANQLNLFDS
jgi:IS4 transposase